MKKDKGFTLIELLAVIVILAIIALIATPQIMNVINEAKKGAFQDSTYGIIKAAEQGYAQSLIKTSAIEATEYEYVNGNKNLKQGNLELNYKGMNPDYGKLLINEEGKIAIVFYNNGFCATKSYEETIVNIEKANTKEECMTQEIIVETNYFDETKGVNKPQLVTGMTPIRWDSNNNEIETNENDPLWYDYNNKKWANVKTEDGSYWVWIPRYAYKITNGYHIKTVSPIVEIKFLKNKTNIAVDETTVESNDYDVATKNTSMHHFLHPSFSNDSEVGYWVAKFEASLLDQNSECYINNNVANCNKNTLVPTFIPNASSWRHISIGNAFQVAFNIKENKDVYGFESAELDTHMITNYEWGAVAYLTHSSYGKNAEVWINPSNNYITGCAGDKVNASSTSGCPNQYVTENGIKASTTGNIYGIYDMSGGAWDMVSAYIDNNNDNLELCGSSIIIAEAKYKNIYSVGSEDNSESNYTINKNVYGDAIYETSESVSSPYYNSWNNDYSLMPNTLSPWFMRGGLHSGSNTSGLFYFVGGSGGPTSSGTFRAVVSPLK